jgi:hypothetical protein
MKNERIVRVAAAWFLMLALAAWAAPASAGDESTEGVVDPSPFEDLGGDENLSLYVNLGPALLGMMSAMLKSEDPELAESVARLDSITAVIVDLTDPDIREDGIALLKSTVRDLQRKRWERLALIRDSDAEIHVMVRGTEDAVSGLVMLMYEKDATEPQLIFANLSGLIDLAKLQELGEIMDIPGLEEVEIER